MKTIKFRQKCFIRKNSNELYEKLFREIAHRSGTCLVNDFREGSQLLVAGEDYYRNYDNERDIDNKLISDGYVDCGDNEELFLSVAALSDDTDYLQWFCDDKKSEWIKCKVNNSELFTTKNKDKFMDTRNGFLHKATLKELIEHFKK